MSCEVRARIRHIFLLDTAYRCKTSRFFFVDQIILHGVSLMWIRSIIDVDTEYSLKSDNGILVRQSLGYGYKSANFPTLIASAGNEVDVVVPLESVLEVKEHFENSVYRFFLGKRIANLVVENYVKNAWSRFGLVCTMLNLKGKFFLKFSSKTGMKSMLENGSWLINTYRASMCMEAWGRSSFMRAMIDLHADVELKYIHVMTLPKIEDLFKLRILIRRDNRHAKQKDTNSNKVSGNNNSSLKFIVDIASSNGNSKDVKFNNEDNDSENDVEEDNNKTTSFMTSKSSKGTGSSKSGSRTGKQSL
ncbi:RNA-directed DNA polymerase, eukaryota, reverse transcriptase zinc-binding domain protein [Tanacetum coccineum]|uniref:RNA-directed DNA polymerase, eukaryota, reverse transcriptase zinc-binding domain protein n=1 Tax=Tanacetum coccineum TaxID=301880 RepID=A0ABQ4ZYJ4_9ASTR